MLLVGIRASTRKPSHAEGSEVVLASLTRRHMVNILFGRCLHVSSDGQEGQLLLFLLPSSDSSSYPSSRSVIVNRPTCIDSLWICLTILTLLRSRWARAGRTLQGQTHRVYIPLHRLSTTTITSLLVEKIQCRSISIPTAWKITGITTTLLADTLTSMDSICTQHKITITLWSTIDLRLSDRQSRRS